MVEKTVDQVLKDCSLLNEKGKLIPKYCMEKPNASYVKNVKTVFSTGTKLETELKVAFTLVENISCKNSLLDHNFK